MSFRTMINNCDDSLICFLQKISPVFARLAIFIIFFWFGILKVFDLSPATPLVEALHSSTIVSFWEFTSFMMFFGLFEMFIGILFLIPKFTRLAIAVLVAHMFMTILPLFILPSAVWDGFLVPTLEGQYIIKNIIVIALAIGIASNLIPMGHINVRHRQ